MFHSPTHPYLKLLHDLVLAMIFATAVNAYAAESSDSEEKAQYIQITPSLVTNFRADNLRYFKADVALKVRSNQSILMAVESHLPRIKHQLLMLLARQELEGITSADGRQALKEQARDDILDILSEEGIDANIEEVLFTGFLVE